MVSIIQRVKNIFVRPTTTPQLGTIFLRPSEKQYAPEISRKEGVTVSIPETGETYNPTTKTFVSGGGGGSGSGTATGGQGISSQIPKGNIEQAIDPVGFAEKQAKTLEQQRLDTEFKTKSGDIIAGRTDRQRTYQEVIGENNQRYIRVEETTKEGLPIQRSIYYVNPSGNYNLISRSQPKRENLQPSQIPQASIKDILKLGDKELIFESTQPLYKTPEGKLATAYGTFDITEDAVIQEEEERRTKAAEQFISDKQYAPIITEPTNEKSVISKIFKELKVLYTASQFGITSDVETEGDVKRKWVSIGGSGGGGGIFIPKFNFATLDVQTAKEIVERQETERNIAGQQIMAIEDLGKLIEGTPSELQYDVQQLGLQRLKNLGINYVVNEDTGELVFTSKEITPKKSFAGLELARTEGFEKVAVATTIVGIKGLEFFGGGELLGLGARGIKYGYQVVKGGVGLGEGLRLTEVAVEGGKIIGTAEMIEASASKGILGKLGRAAVVTGVGGLYVVGKVSQYGSYTDIYGKDIGKELFILETSGEIAGIGASIGKGVIENIEIKKANEQIILRNAEREITLERLENVKHFGQFSSQARVTFAEIGTGRSVLTKGEREILKGVFVREAGLSSKEAEQLIKEGGAYVQNLVVGSPAGFEPFTFSRAGISASLKKEIGFKELGLEFTRGKGGRVSNIVLKATTGEGKYSVTSVFEKTRRTKAIREILEFGDMKFIKEIPSGEFKLKDVIVSKVGKQRIGQLGEISVSAAQIESRLLKGFRTLGQRKDRTTLLETLELGIGGKRSEADLKKLFEGAGVSARTSPKPMDILRIEKALYRKEGILKVNRDGEFVFRQFGRSGRQLSFRNEKDLLKDIDYFKDLENVLRTRKPKRTPFSVTFGEATTEENFVKEIEKKIQIQRVMGAGQKAAQMPSKYPKMVGGEGIEVLDYSKAFPQKRQFEFEELDYGKLPPSVSGRSGSVSISPAIVSGFKFNVGMKGLEKLKVSEDIISRSGLSVKSAIKELLGMASVSKTKQKSIAKERVVSAVREKTLQQEVQTQQERQRLRQSPRLRSQPELRLERIPFMTEITRTPNPRIRPERFVFNFGKENKKMKNILNLKKILQQDELAFFPTFTAKALDIPATEVSSVKEAMRLIKQIRTGFETTGGVRIRA